MTRKRFNKLRMTREIALYCMKSASELERELCRECPISGQSEHCYEDALQYVIKYLEQEPVLDKMRAEIETKYGHSSICEYDSDYGGKWYQVGDVADILHIIDEYKYKTEDKND